MTSQRQHKSTAMTMVKAVGRLTALSLLAAFFLSAVQGFAPVRVANGVNANSLGGVGPQQQNGARPPFKAVVLGAGSTSDDALASPLDEPLLAGLDAAALIVFASVGKASHSADGSIDLAAVLAVAFPFLLSWFGTSPFTGVYKDDCGDFRTTLKGWAVSVPLGCALRGIIKGYVPPAPFVVVTLISTLAILSGTRFAYSKLASEE